MQVVDRRDAPLHRLDEDRRPSVVAAGDPCGVDDGAAGDDRRSGPLVTTPSSWSSVRRASANPLDRLTCGAGTTRCTRSRGSAEVTPCRRAAVAPESADLGPAHSRAATCCCRTVGGSRKTPNTWGRITRQARPAFQRTAGYETPFSRSWARVTTPSWRANRSISLGELGHVRSLSAPGGRGNGSACPWNGVTGGAGLWTTPPLGQACGRSQPVRGPADDAATRPAERCYRAGLAVIMASPTR